MGLSSSGTCSVRVLLSPGGDERQATCYRAVRVLAEGAGWSRVRTETPPSQQQHPRSQVGTAGLGFGGQVASTPGGSNKS